MDTYVITFQPPHPRAEVQTMELQADEVTDAIDLFVQHTTGDDCWEGSRILGISMVQHFCPTCAREYNSYDTYCLNCGNIRRGPVNGKGY